MCSLKVKPIYTNKMIKQKYIAPFIESISTMPESDTCNNPVYLVFFSKQGPGVAGAKQGSLDEFSDCDDVDAVGGGSREACSTSALWGE